MGAIDYMTTSKVDSPEKLCDYICQTTGTPWATLKDQFTMRKKCNQFFTQYPHLDYSTLCHVADWCQRRRRRYSHVWKVVDAFRYAYEDGALPEVDRRVLPNLDIESQIVEALNVETDKVWRMRLIGTDGQRFRKEVLEDWLTMREPKLKVLS